MEGWCAVPQVPLCAYSLGGGLLIQEYCRALKVYLLNNLVATFSGPQKVDLFYNSRLVDLPEDCDLGMRIGILVAARVADRRAATAPRPTPHINDSRN